MARAVVLAGGFGTRLARPEGDVPPGGLSPAECPKALTPLGGVPILEIILHQLRDGGFEHVTLCLFWRADLIVEHLGDGSRIGLELEYSLTERRLGSAGPLAAVDPGSEPQLILNCDLLTSIDFGRVLRAHRETGATATVVALRRKSRLDYGVLELSEDRRLVRGHVEKPVVEHVISAGINVLEPSVWRHLRAGAYLDMPTLLQTLIEEGAAVMPFLIDGEERWIDMGRPDTYSHADEAFRREPGRFLRGSVGRGLLERVKGSNSLTGAWP
ncbi:MAG TPA: sugar phosphate nucleotidyltransferase [Solirubrobacterales bacterium]|nr:sugar phosphate nucleotidyltransferase [Solirubrobacterales bacterium]